MRVPLLLAILGMLGITPMAQAQTDPYRTSPRSGAERIRVSLNGIEQVTARTLSQNFSVTKNLEQATIAANLDLPSSPLFDVGGSVRLVNQLAIGVAVAALSHSISGSVEATIPHPLYFNMPRTVAGDLSGLERKDTAVHIAVLYFIPVGKLDIGVFGGPSRFDIKQDLITDISYTESYPFDSASFSAAPSTTVSTTVMGYNVGTDVTWRLSRNVGVGGLIRFASASTTFSAASGNEVEAKIGGLQAGGGLRLIF